MIETVAQIYVGNLLHYLQIYVVQKMNLNEPEHCFCVLEVMLMNFIVWFWQAYHGYDY